MFLKLAVAACMRRSPAPAAGRRPVVRADRGEEPDGAVAAAAVAARGRWRFSGFRRPVQLRRLGVARGRRRRADGGGVVRRGRVALVRSCS